MLQHSLIHIIIIMYGVCTYIGVDIVFYRMDFKRTKKY